MKKMLPNPPDLFFLVSITSSLLIMPLRQGVKLLRSGTSSSGQIKIKKDLDESIEGEHVIVIEDIIDSGNTPA